MTIAANTASASTAVEGGGCVYADRDNLMLSFVTLQTEQVGFAFNRFVGMVLLVLRKMGIEVVGISS